MDDVSFIKDYLKFYDEVFWERCIHYLMNTYEDWPKEKCIKLAEKLRRERLSPETPKGEAIV